MSDVQDESVTEVKAAAEEVVEEVTQPRSQRKHVSRHTGLFFSLVLLCIVAGAGWYYKQMWLPQAQKLAVNYLPPQAWFAEVFAKPKQWFADLSSFADRHDPRDAPLPEETGSVALDDGEPNYVVSAIVEPDPVAVPESNSEEVIVIHSNPVVPDNTNNAEPAEVMAQPTDSVFQEKEKTPSQTEEITDTQVAAVIEKPAVPDRRVPAPASAAVDTEATNASALGSAESDEIVVREPLAEINPADINLSQARHAFWQRDLPKAEAIYTKLANQAGADADSWGELGNVYYLQAKWQKAASAYAEAALILLKQGELPQAMYLRYIAAGLDPEQAKRIDEQLHALQSPAQG